MLYFGQRIRLEIRDVDHGFAPEGRQAGAVADTVLQLVQAPGTGIAPGHSCGALVLDHRNPAGDLVPAV